MEVEVDLSTIPHHPKTQAPDDPFHERDSQYVPCDSFYPVPFWV